MGGSTSTTNRGNTIAFMENKPFSQGSIRYCFYGIIIDGPNLGDHAVIKVFKHKPIRSSYIDAKKQMKVYSYANDYARMFNDLLKAKGYKQKISFPQPDLVRVEGMLNKSLYFIVNDYICAQKYLPGKYQKFTNNYGYTNGTQLMQCFQHYTYIKSGKQAICCDLQGVYSNGVYTLTDPAVNSISQMFGNTDIGEQGIKQILRRHKCNKICKDLGFEDSVQYNKYLQPVNNSTTLRRSHTSGI